MIATEHCFSVIIIEFRHQLAVVNYVIIPNNYISDKKKTKNKKTKKTWTLAFTPSAKYWYHELIR